MTPERIAELARASPWAADWLRRHPELAEMLCAEGFFERPVDFDAETAALVERIAEGDEAAAMRELRWFRQRHGVRVVWRELAGLADLNETMDALSRAAEAGCRAALARCWRVLEQRHGRLRAADGSSVQPVILGMGKLGGRELNFSSDIDLICLYSAPGESDGERPLSADEWFARLVRDCTRLLAQVTVDGFAWRVDWRLRPFGEAGPPAVSFDAMEHYLLVHGREWERYALVKARVVAGDALAGQRLLETIRPFVYRRYLDYDAIGALRDLKQKIRAEVARRELHDHIKLGPGGIREIEFVVQAFQLIRGGQEPALRQPSLRPVLHELGRRRLMEATTVHELDQAYCFLRRLENALQWYADRQTHRLPKEPEAREAAAASLGLADWSRLREALDAHRSRVESAFAALFGPPQRPAGAQAVEAALAALWDRPRPDEAAALRSALGAGGCASPDGVVEAVCAFLEARAVRALGSEAERRVRALLATLLCELASREDADTSARRVLGVVLAIIGRSTYLSLLTESATARTQLIRLCAASPWVAELLAQSPALLDALLDPRSLYAPPDAEGIRAELAALIESARELGTEQRMDALRRFRQEITLRVAAADVLEALPLVKVSDRLTWLAEALIEAVLGFVAEEMHEQYGTPLRSDGRPAQLAVIGYGKLGGIEMGYGSDLDLVFLHDADDPQRETRGGERAIANAVYFARMAQRVVNWLSARTAAGRIYEVDLRLRPSGDAGLLVSSLEGFAQYQRENAWTWEHQALVRARPVAGSPEVGEQFARIRREILCAPRDADRLRAEVVSMRERMRSELSLRVPRRIDLKHAPGGLTDVEFLTQYLVLRHAHAHPELVRWTDNWRQTDDLVTAGLLPAADGEALIRAYRNYRAYLHARDLQQQDHSAEPDAFAEDRAAVAGLWTRYLGAEPGAPPEADDAAL